MKFDTWQSSNVLLKVHFFFVDWPSACVEQEGHVNSWHSGHLTSPLILPESVFNVIINVFSSNICVYIFC